MQQEVLWFQLCLLLWEARDKVRRDPHSGMCPSHPSSHQLLGSCKIHHFPSTHAGGNNDNKNKIRMTPFPRQGGAERERALGNGLDFTASPGKRDFSERKSPPRACPLCLQKQVLSQPFPCHWIWSEGLWSCHFPHAKAADLSSLLQPLRSQTLLLHSKKTSNPPTM